MTVQSEGALEVAMLGRGVIPLWGVIVSTNGVPNRCECPDGEGCPDAGKHPRERGNWKAKATTNPDTILDWARRFPQANFAYVMDGEQPQIALDVDPRNGGNATGLPRTNWMVNTGGGGLHIVGVRPERSSFPGVLRQGVEVKAAGRYLVCPGSMHVSGKRYRFLVHPGEEPVVGFPDDLFQTPATNTNIPDNGGSRTELADLLRHLPQREGEGQGRNVAMAAVAGHLFKSDLHPEGAAELVRVVNSTLAEPLTEINKVINSIGAREHARADPDDWAPTDLSAFDHAPDPERFGPGSMFYRGAVHWASGEPESGKSVLAYAAAVGEMRAGRAVLLLDEDAGSRDVNAKMRALGATEAMLRDLLVYMRPAGRNLVRDRARLFALVQERQPSLVIVDAAADHLGAAGLDEDRAPEVTKFVREVLKPLAHDRNIAVVVIDHKTKADPNGRYGRGSGAKLAKSDAAYNVSAPEPFSRDRSGRIHVACTKDKLGYIGRDTSWMVHVHVEGGRLRLECGSPLTPDETRQMLGQTRRGPNDSGAGRIVALLSGRLLPMPTAEIAAALGLSRTRTNTLLLGLEGQGSIERGKGDRPNKLVWRVVQEDGA